MEKSKHQLLKPTGCLSREAVLAWLENRLSPAEKNVIEDHLQECILCREAIEGFESSDASRVRAAFADINTNMQQRLIQQEKKGLSRQMKLSLAAAVLLMLIGIFGVFKFRPVEKPMEIAQEINQPKFEQKALAPARVITDTFQNQVALEKSTVAKNIAKEKISDADESTINEVDVPAQTPDAVTETMAGAAIAQKEETPAEETEALAYNAPTAAKRSSEPVSAKTARYAEKAIAVEYNDKTETTYYAVEEPARFQGGDISKFKTYIENKLTSEARENDLSIAGNLTVSFIVDKNGKVKDVFVVKGLDARTDSIVKKIAEKSPVWQPARQQGKAVNVNMVVEIVLSRK